MSNKLRDIFKPSTNQKIAQYESIIEHYEKDFGECTTCVNFIPPPRDLPGFVTDYGECGKNMDIFGARIYRFDKMACEHYKYNKSPVDALKREIEKLRKEKICF